MPDPFGLPFFQRGVVEVLVLAPACGLLGPWIVLRGHSFFAHAVGTATFPGLVLAAGIGVSPLLGALAAALLVAALVSLLAGRRGADGDAVTALALAAALALGVVLASDVFHSRASVDRLLFGSLLTIDPSDVCFAAVASIAAIAASWTLGGRWLATGFAAGAGARPAAARADAALVALIALVAVAVLAAVGALLASSLLVVPAATTRLWADRLGPWQRASTALAALEGVGGLWLAFELNAPPGAAIAVLCGGLFALAALARALSERRLRRVGPEAAL